MSAPPSSSAPARAVLAAVRQATARSSAATEAGASALPLAAPRRRGASRVDAQTPAGSSSVRASSSSPPLAPAASSPCRCGRSPCTCCACGRCGRAVCRCGPSYGAALPALSLASSAPAAGPWRHQQQRGVSSSSAAAAAAAEPSKKEEEQQQTQQEQAQQQPSQQQQQEQEQQEQEQEQQQEQQQQQPQHLFTRLRETLFGGGASSSSPNDGGESAADRARRLLSAAAREVADAVLPREERVSLTRAYEGPVWQPPAPGSPEEAAAMAAGNGTTTALAVAPAPPPSAAQKLLDDLKARFGSHPLFSRLSAAAQQAPGSAAAAGAAGAAGAAAQAAARRAQEAVDALKDRYETSDHPAVHKAEEVKERLFGATEAAEALAEAFRRDPRFDVARLLASVKHDARTVVAAFLAHDLKTLKCYAGPELLERLSGVFAHFDAQGGLREDPTILFVGDPELVEVRTVEGDPMVVVQFACQQIKATRDKFGNVVDGSPNSIQRVFYFWGLVQEKQGVVLPDGRPLPPRWVLRDMMWQSVLALV